MEQSIVIHWFRQDLRLEDNPALTEAANQGAVLPIYIFDDETDQHMGAASRVWLHHSLQSLNESLEGKLAIYQGDAKDILQKLIQTYKISDIYWNKCYEPAFLKRDAEIQKTITCNIHEYNGALLWNPDKIKTNNGKIYHVFTPFYNNGCLQAPFPRKPLAAPKLKLTNDTHYSTSLDKLALLPKHPWYKETLSHWDIGEAAAQNQLNTFLRQGLKNYDMGRDIPASNAVSKLSPYLRFGEISPNIVWYKTLDAEVHEKEIKSFCRQLGWREFAYYMLYHHPYLPKENLQTKFNNFSWDHNPQALRAWQKGETGIPFVDAAMRQLWQEGYMHNRVRMVVGSFLVKNLRIHWRHGLAWFDHCLFDADLASNSASWQWVAGTGIDAAPYFRIFNPVLQGQKFDPEGLYTRKFVPELKYLPNKYLFCPWEAPPHILQKANIDLGTTYPLPAIDLKSSRNQALQAYKEIK